MRASISKLVAVVVGAAFAVVPTTLLACPVCGAGGNEDNAWAYTVMSVVLTVLPLGMIGGVVYWVAQRQDATDVPEHQDSF